MWGAGNCEKMQLNWRVDIDILWEGDDGVLMLVSGIWN